MRLAEFAGTPRFEVRRRIGAGAMGVVYEAFDRHRGMRVAIKTLSRLDAVALYRLKREFRSLADVVHDNLVRFHELVSEGDDWFFAMDLITGVDLLTYIWGYGPGYRAEPSRIDVLDATETGTAPISAPVQVGGLTADEAAAPPPLATTTSSPEAMARLRTAFRQLVIAVDVVHRAGKLHRDVKPANVLVEPSGRLVLLDFGIAADLHDDTGVRSREATDSGGTPAYMAPEQAEGGRNGPAVDWYAVGAVLYEALTGRVPFRGSALAVLVAKQSQSPPRPSDLVSSVPPELDALCQDLLARDPDERPGVAEILSRLEGDSVPAPVSSGVVARPSTFDNLVGRGTPLATLRVALDAVRSGRPAFAQVVGPSGIGKSALVRHFLTEAEATGDAVVLSGRCYEREWVPYKGFDAIIDGLSQYLTAFSRDAAAGLSPRDAAALTRVFPVLARAEGLMNAPRRMLDTTDPHQIRTRAFGALRELLRRVGDRRPVIVFIDDFQWADADSAALLAEMIAPPDPPSLLVVLAYRSEDVPTDPWFSILMRAGRRSSAPPQPGAPPAPFTCTLTLEALSDADARIVAADLLDVEEGDARATSIAHESGGSPFFLGELARYARASEQAGPVRLGDVVESRLRALPAAALALLEIVAVAGHPIDRDTALAAAELPAREGDAGLAAVRAAHLVRVLPGRAERVEPYHDRIRETMLRTLTDDAKRAHHARLAEVLLGRGESDPDVLFAHFDGAGDRAHAMVYAEEAAARAASLLAFERAAAMYRRALDLCDDQPSRRRLRLLLAESLARAGRGAAAADLYARAAEDEQGAARLDLQKKASEQLLFSGHIDRGIELVRQVLAQEGMRLAPTPLVALLRLVLLRIFLALRGRGFQLRPERAVAPHLLARIDTCNVVANGLSFVDNIQGRVFQARGMLLAMKAGEASRVAHALAGEAIFVGASGWRRREQALALLDQAERVCRTSGVTDKLGAVEYARGMVLHVTGEWPRARASFEQAQALLDGVGDRSFRVELDGALSYGISVLILLGRLREASVRHAALRREADDRGDLFLGTNLCIGFANQCWLFADDADTARSVAAEAMARWSPRGFHLQHWHELLALTFVDLYEGQPERALERIASRWRPLKRSMLMRLEITALQALYLRATANVAVAARAAIDMGPHLEAALRDAAVLKANGVRWGHAMGELVVAGVESLRGRTAEAERAATSALQGFEETHLELFAAATRRRLGMLRGGSEGNALIAAADDWMTGEGVRRPGRIARMIAPTRE